jgi:AAA family ATP:ADP antiporter
MSSATATIGQLRDAVKAIISPDLRAVSLAATAFFLLLFSNYVLRPLRNAMALQIGVERFDWLFTGTFLFTLVTVPVFGWVAKHLPRSWLIPGVYSFLATTLLIFYALFAVRTTVAGAAAFCIWLSVFNLLVISLFWTGMSDSFSTEESHRFYGYVAAGGTLGGLVGPATTALFVESIGARHLLLLAAGLLAAATGCMLAFRRLRSGAGQDQASERPIGGSLLAGVRLTCRRPVLRGVALLVICNTAISTVLYIELAEAVSVTHRNMATRVAFYAALEFTGNGLALFVQLLGTRRIVQRHGLRVAFSIVPLATLLILLFLGSWRTTLFVAIVQVVQRVGELSLMRPCREMLYTTVDAESRYKARNFIDTAVYRGNDAAIAWLVTAIRSAGLSAAWLVALPAAGLWLVTGFRLGKRHDQRSGATPRD